MLYLPSEPTLVPSRNLFILDYDGFVSFHFVDQLIGHVLFSVRELLVLPLDKPDRLVAVIRSFDSSRHLSLQFFESIAFSNRHVELLTFGCCDIGLYPEIKTYFLSVSLLFFEILFIDETRHFQVVSVRLSNQIRIGQFIGNLKLAASPD